MLDRPGDEMVTVEKRFRNKPFSFTLPKGLHRRVVERVYKQTRFISNSSIEGERWKSS
jgi:hypothetical protein